MNYKDIIKSRRLRIKILSLLGWIPDSIMLRLQYRMQTGRWPNLTNPKRYTEKIQVYKMKYRNPAMLRCTDKYEARNYVREKGLGDILVPLIGVYDSPDEIDYGKLPQQFVAKTTDGGGGNQVLVCKDKAVITESSFRERLGEWMSAPKPKKSVGREWAYDNGYPRRILIEHLIGGELDDLPDYKFFCFGGKVTYVYGITDRHIGESGQFGFYDADFNKLDVDLSKERHQETALLPPINYEAMKKVAETLSRDFPHVRVDLYNVNGKIYFGELTFYDGSGYFCYKPDSFDFTLGKDFDTSAFL